MIPDDMLLTINTKTLTMTPDRHMIVNLFILALSL